MDDTIRKQTALKELKRKIAEVESEIRTQVDIVNELTRRLWRSDVNVIHSLGLLRLWRRLRDES